MRLGSPRTRGAALVALALSLLVAAPAQAAPRTVRGSAAQSAAQARYLALDEEGVSRARQRLRDSRRGWYDARLGDRERYPLATIWDIVPLFESLDAIAIAQPD